MMKTALWALTAMTACSATAVAQNESQRKLVCTYTLGEILDEGTSANKITKKVVNFYNKQGRIFKSCEYGTGTTDEFTLTKMFDMSTLPMAKTPFAPSQANNGDSTTSATLASKTTLQTMPPLPTAPTAGC